MTAIVRGSNLDKVARAVTEAELQSWVLELCKVLGLLVFHSGDSRRDRLARAGQNAAVWRPTDWFDDTVGRELKAIR